MGNIGFYMELLALGVGFGCTTSCILFLLGFGIYKAFSLLNIKN